MNLPPPFSWLYRGWMAFSHVLGMVMSRLILTLLWIVGFGIYAVVFKVIHLVQRKTLKPSYWEAPPEEFEGRLKYQF